MTSSKSPPFAARFASTALMGLAAILLFPALACSAGEGALLWEQDFTQHETGPTEDFGKNLEIREENGVKFLSKQDSEVQFMMDKESRSIAASTWIDYVYTVRFREPEKPTMSMVVKARGDRPEVPYLWYYVTVGPSGIGVLCHGIPKDGQYQDDPRRKADVSYESMGASVLTPGEWITAKVAVGNEVIKVTVEAEDRQPRPAEFKVFPGSGGVSVGSRSPVDIAKATVHEAGQAVMAAP